LGWPANPTFFFQKTQKRGLVLNLALLKKELQRENLAKKRKKFETSNYGRHPLQTAVSGHNMGKRDI
jgi:hypothetical protein